MAKNYKYDKYCHDKINMAKNGKYAKVKLLYIYQTIISDHLGQAHITKGLSMLWPGVLHLTIQVFYLLLRVLKRNIHDSAGP